MLGLGLIVNAVCKFRVIASEAKQSLIEKRLLRRLAAPRNDTDNKNSKPCDSVTL